MKKAQRTLDYFLLMECKRKQFFYVDWTIDNPEACWLDKIEAGMKQTFKATVKWKTVGDIVISCNEDVDSPLYESPMIKGGEGSQKMISFLKSHLQKAIRRQKLDQALSTSLQLIAINIEEFLRRLCIIVFEDVQLQAFFSNLMWLTSAVTKGYKVRKRDIDMILSYVVLLIKDNTALHLSFSSKEEKKDYGKYLDVIEKNKSLTMKQRNLLYCLIFRISYGGMEWDMNMLNGYFQYYLNLFISGKSLEENAIESIDSNTIPLEIKKDDYVIESIDFHCFPSILFKIKEDITINTYTNEELKNCIWEYNSKINTRCDNTVADSSLEIIWMNIKTNLRNEQYNILSSSILPEYFELFNKVS